MNLAQRAADPELLDGDGLGPGELGRNLRAMARLNRLPGGSGASAAAIRRLLPDDGGTVVDIGIGGGDLARRLLRDPGIDVIGVDRRADVLEVARVRAGAGQDGRLTLLQADACALPLADASVDVAHASLMLHHLDPTEAVTALTEMRRVARHGVVVNDLRRGLLAFAVTAATVLALARDRVTRSDGVLSARRAYTLGELDELAAAAGLRVAWRSPTLPPRVVTVYR